MNGTEIAVFKPIEADLADLEHRYAGVVFDVTTPDGMAVAKAAQKDIAGYRIALEKARVKEKEASLTYGKKVDFEAKTIAARIAKLETPISAMIDEVAKREQREREAAVKAEEARILAEQAKAKAAEEAKMAADRAEIARQQAEIAKAQREAAAEAEAARRKIEEEGRAARAKIEEQEREARLAREAADRIALQQRTAAEAESKRIRDDEEARLKAERDEIDRKARLLAEAQRREQEATEAKAKAKRDAEEAKQREIQHAKAELLDGEALLRTFYSKYGALPRFQAIARQIADFLEGAQATNDMMLGPDGKRSIFDDVDA